MVDVSRAFAFARSEVGAARVSNAAIEELAAVGVVGDWIEWRVALFPVARSQTAAYTEQVIACASSTLHYGQSGTMGDIDEVATTFS